MKYFSICFLAVSHFAVAQNLVPNPGFEEYTICPTTYSTDPNQFGPLHWNSPTHGTPDYFNRCSIGDMDVPRNWAGVSYPHSGVAYVGIFAWNNTKNSYREYIQCKLTEPLRSGTSYNLQFFYKLSSYSVYAVGRIGMSLSNSELKVDYDSVLLAKPALSNVVDIETLTNEWIRASATFRANGGEQFLIIGNFSNNKSTENKIIEYRAGTSLILGGSGYYYIDDVSVVATDMIAKEPADSLSITESNVKINEKYTLKHIHFSLASYELLPSSFPELDRVISVLKKNPNWKVELTGHTDDQGSDEYNLRLSQQRAMSVGQYLVRKGVDSDRIRILGFGKQKPIHESTDEVSRSVNRRVEAKFFD